MKESTNYGSSKDNLKKPNWGWLCGRNQPPCMVSLLTSSDSTSVKLGPAVYAEIEFEGYPVRALVDTGSPATIMSLDCMLSALAEGRPRDQTPLEWESAVKQRLEPPEITLWSYGGGKLDIIAQLSVTVRSGMHCKEAVVLV